jgi:hypothetical protein
VASLSAAAILRRQPGRHGIRAAWRRKHGLMARFVAGLDVFDRGMPAIRAARRGPRQLCRAGKSEKQKPDT